MDEKYLREYADNGALMDLSGMDFADIEESIVESGRTEDGLFGIATGINAMAMMTNPDILEDAGVEMPDDTTWTWDDFADVSREVAENTDSYGFGSPNEPGSFQIWLRQNGKELTNADGSLGFEAADAAEYYGMLLDMMKDGALPQASVITEDQSPGPDQSLTGKGEAAMGMWWSNQLAALNASSGADLVPLRFPSVAGSADEAHLFHKSAMYMSGSARTEHPEEVEAFIDFMVNSEEAGLINLADRGLPANSTVREAVIPELSEADALAAEYVQAIEPELGAAMPIPPLGFSALQEILYRYELDVLFERTTPEEAGERAIAEMETAIG
jgi:multiple sugar transport system substrate-binding protein